MKKGIKLLILAVALLAAGASAFAELDLFDIQRNMVLGKKTIVVPAEAQNEDLAAIVDCIKEGEGITLDLSATRITAIGDHAFSFCDALKGVILPSTLTTIGEVAFGYCYNLTSLTIPASVTSIGEGAFNACTSLAKIDVASDNKSYESVDGVLFSKDKATLVRFPPRKAVEYYEVPEGTVYIGDSAFDVCTGLKVVKLPDGVKSIGNYVFNFCTNLTLINLPSSVTSIGHQLFWACTSLAKIDVASDNKNYASVDGVLFSKDKATLIYFPAGKNSEYYEVPKGTVNIEAYAFNWCTSLTSLTIPASVTSIGEGAFNVCDNLTSVTFKSTKGWYLDEALTQSVGAWELTAQLKRARRCTTRAGETRGGG